MSSLKLDQVIEGDCVARMNALDGGAGGTGQLLGQVPAAAAEAVVPAAVTKDPVA